MTEPSNADLWRRLDHVLEVIADHSEVDRQAHEEAAIARAEVLRKLDAQAEATKGLVEAWGAMGGLVKVAKWAGALVKWCSGMAIACGILWALVKVALGLGKAP